MFPPALFGMYSIALVYSGCFVWCSSASSHQLRAVFSMGGIKGDVIFSQRQNRSSTSIMVDITGVNETLTWDIRQLPMIYDGNADMSCNSSAIGAIFDPTMAMKSENYSNSCRLSNASRFHDCAVGDLTRMLGALDANSAQQNFTFQNLTIPISGPNSIMGRTLVLYKGGIPKACALITPAHPMITAVAVFSMPVAGFVYLRQVKDHADTTIFVNLFYSNDAQSQSQFSWQINQASSSCGTSGDLFSPENNNGHSCSRLEHDKCRIGDLTSKHGNITVSMATNSQSATKAAFIDTNLPLTGANSVVGKTIALFSRNDSQTPFACATIKQVKPRVFKTAFKSNVHDGVDGYFKFTQLSPFDPTTTEIQLTGLNKKAEGYHVHNYPMPWQMTYTGSQSCAGGFLGGHWNPFGVDVNASPSAGTGTNDQYEIGDLSGKYGSFLNLTSYSETHVDYNLPLFGKNSIQGRSIVIHKQKTMGSGRWVCAVIGLTHEEGLFVMTTKVTFVGPALQGYILLTQYNWQNSLMASEETSVYADLKYVNDSSKQSLQHSWHVHVNPEGGDTYAEMGKRCKSLGGHYNPYGVDLAGTYKPACSSGNMLRCEVGDLSGKHERLNIGSGKQFYTDPSLPLFGEWSVVGRGIVVHAENSGSGRLACATIKPVNTFYVEKTLNYVEGTTFSRVTFTKSISELLKIPDWRLFYIREEESRVQGCMTVKFGIMGNANQVDEPSKTFDLIVSTRPGMLKEFQPKTKCLGEPPIPTKPSGTGINRVNIFFVLLSVVLVMMQASLE